MPKKPWFCCGRAECRDLLRNVVGREGIKKTRRFCCERALSISGTRGRSILVFREPPIVNLQSFFYIVLPNGNLNKKVWEWLMVQRARRTQLQRTVSGLFCIEIRVSIALPLFHLFAIVGDYSYIFLGISTFFKTTFQVGYHLHVSIQHQQKLKWQQWLDFPFLLL